ncbi:MAG: hypothetical protein R2726_23280 [Acidimicrobiales bacterium]
MWNLLQQYQIQMLQNRAVLSDTSRELDRQRTTRQVDDLEAELETMRLALAAAWELLAGRLGVSEEELVHKMREIDGRDGVVDGRRTPAVGRRCPSCEAVIPPGGGSCQFCGHHVGGDDPFS